MNAKDSGRCAQAAHQAVSCVHLAAHQSLHCRVYEMDAKESGRGAQAQFRLDGRVVTQAEYEAAQNAKFNATKRRPKYVEEEVAWKGGLAQMRAAAAAQAAEAAEVRFCATFYNLLRSHAFTDLLTAGTRLQGSAFQLGAGALQWRCRRARRTRCGLLLPRL